MNIEKFSRKVNIDLSQKIETFYVILPESSLKFYWDIFIMSLLITLGFLIPIEFAFIGENQSLSEILSKLTLSVFTTDILFNLNTGIYIKGELIKHRSKFISHYLKFWFWIDLVSTIPFELMFTGSVKLTTVVGENFNILKAFKLLKLIRLVRFPQIIMKIEDHMTSKKSLLIVNLAKIMIYLSLLANSAGCVMYITSSQNTSPDNFINQIEASAGMEDYTIGTLYTYCLYWSITTMASIGYGDLHPHVTSERIVGILIMNFSSITFGYLLGNIGDIISKHTAKVKERREVMVNLNRLTKEHKIPEDLKRRVLKHANFHFAQSKNKIDFSNTISILSPPLREEIYSHINGKTVRSFPLFVDIQDSCIARISRVLKPQLNSPNDCLIKEKTESLNMFYILRGCVEIIDETTGSSIKILSTRTYFGEIGLFLNLPRCATVYSITFLETLVLYKNEFIMISVQYPELQQKIAQVQNFFIDGDLTNIFVECFLCKKIGHVAKSCSKMTQKSVHQRNWLNSRRESKIITNNSNIVRKLRKKDEKLLKMEKIYSQNVWGKKRRIHQIFPKKKVLRKAARDYLNAGSSLGCDLYSPRLSIFSNDSEVSEYMQNYMNYDIILNNSEDEIFEKEEKPRLVSFDTTLLESTKNDG